MKLSLNVKLIISFVIFAVVGFVTTSTVGYQRAYRENLSTHEAHMHRVAKKIADSYMSDYYSSSITLDDLKLPLSILGGNLDAEIWLINTEGNVWYSSKSTEAFSVPDFDITDFGSKSYMIGDFYGSFSERYLSTYVPITNSYTVRGYVLIHQSMSIISDESSMQLDNMYICYFAVLICFVILILLTQFSQNRRLKKISIIASNYANGNFSEKISFNTADEVGSITASMNYMAHQLNTLEEDQRKFISNVSHDFRSPLTSLKGYLEAIKDGTIPPEMQEKYIDIMLFEAERLSKLSEGLLDLNKYGSKLSMINLQPFDINLVIKQCAMSFEGRCLEKRLVFNLVLVGEQLLVEADKSRIEQVVYNLIDNAIKFSDTDSSIDIETTIRNDKVYVSVKDHGIGIPKEHLGKIFDRFYKSDHSRGKDKKGSGLGLSIVKEIISSHDENISVVSTVGAGTEFTFSLPRADE